MCFSGRSENRLGSPGLWLAETFSTSSLKPPNGILRNLTGSNITTSSTKCVFLANIKTRWPPWPPFSWVILTYYLELLNGFRNSTKLDRTQYLKVLYQVSFLTIRNQECRPGLWLVETFWTSLKPLKGIQRNLTGSMIRTPCNEFVFSGRSENQVNHFNLQLAEHFLPFLCNRWTEINETWKKASNLFST